MDPITIIGITLGLITKFGPDAVKMFQQWQDGLPTDGKPTSADWDRLETLAKSPDAYDPK